MSSRLRPADIQTPSDAADTTLAEEMDMHERLTRAQAYAAAAGAGVEPEIAEPPAGSAMRKKRPVRRVRLPGGAVVEVDVHAADRDVVVAQYGPESRLPRGTPVRQDGTPCVGDEQPYGIIGNLKTEHGIIVSRVIPYADMVDA